MVDSMRRQSLLLVSIMFAISSCGQNNNSSSEISDTNDNSIESSTEQISSDSSIGDSIDMSSTNQPIIDIDEDFDELLDEDYSNIKKLSEITKNPNERMMYDQDFFGEFENIKYQQLYYDNVQDNSRKDGSVDENTDAKYLYYNDEYVRFLNRSDGYAFNFRTDTTFVGDFQRAKYRSKIYNKEVSISVSHETQNPYVDHSVDDRKANRTTERRGWEIYRNEWLLPHINDKAFLDDNELSFTHPSIIDSHDIKDGYSLIIVSVKIDNPNQIRKSYYNVGVIRDVYATQGEDFYLFVMKSTTDRYDDFKDMLLSFEFLYESKGTPKNHYDNLQTINNPNWNENTRKYYELLKSQQRTGWGVFVANVQDTGTIEERQKILSDAFDYDFDIIPSYQHISWNGKTQTFPLDNAKKIAGGNGYNGKPVLQYSFQLTNNNNDVAGSSGSRYTPMFDIYRGPSNVIDLWNMKDRMYNALVSLARSIKEYGEPVLFRLNNEMNTDWTSYSGIVTLLDPDIFIATWRKLYKIFEQEGVDNCIFIFNPIDKSCPYSSWGEDMSYFPGTKYNQILGLTYYEDNNKDNVNEATFRKDYTAYYNKNYAVWKNYPWIISEFGCGAGGDDSGELYRSKESQASYVRGMFNDFNDRKNNPYLQNIKGAVWFSANDYNGSKVTNQYNLLPIDKIESTIQAFKEGLSKNKI